MGKISLVEIKLIGLSLGRKTTNENRQSAIDCGSHWQKFEAGKYADRIPNKINDKIFVVSNPGYVCYFLSSFWQIHKSQVLQVMYSSMIVSFAEIGLWQEPKSQKESYETFYNFNDEIKNILSKHIGRKVTNWEAEHSFWNFRKVTAYTKKETKTKEQKQVEPTKEAPISALTEASFDIYDYIPRVIANFIELGSETEMSESAQRSKYEKQLAKSLSS